MSAAGAPLPRAAAAASAGGAATMQRPATSLARPLKRGFIARSAHPVPAQRQVVDAVDRHAGVMANLVALPDPDVLEPGQHLLEHDGDFPPREMVSDADVVAGAERQNARRT